jgi:hypothetical protein
MEGSPIITLVVRGKRKTFEGSHFVTVGAPLRDEVRTSSVRDVGNVDEEARLLGVVAEEMGHACCTIPRGTFRAF